MSWTTPADLRAQVQRLWDRGDLLRAAVSDAVAWPIRLRLKSPSPTDVSDRFDEVRSWVREVAAVPNVRIEWRERSHRVQGAQRLPVAVSVDTLQDAIALVGKARHVARFQTQWNTTEAQQPELLKWLARYPVQALELADRWERLLAVVAWVRVNPRPEVYLRQVNVTGVDSKFIEAHRSELAEMLDLVLPAEAIDANANGAAQFARRFGFLQKPVRIRFRVLDPSVAIFPGCVGQCDVSLDAASFASLVLPIERVFITENETNFLAFPEAPSSIVVFGAGYGWEALTRATWLHHCRLDYWGDIDTHGFAILHQLRHAFPHVRSFLMDRATLLEHRAFWGEEREPVRHDLDTLTAVEAALFDDLRFERIQPRLRLEQERVGFAWMCERLDHLRLT